MNAERLLAHYERIADTPEAIPRLRRFVLDLAVRGKIVEQEPDDESGSELLQQIAAAKARLVQAGTIRKPRDLGGDEDSLTPFEIPTCWRWVRLDGVGAIIGGGTPSAGDADNFAEPGTGVPWLTPADLGSFSGLFISHGARDLSETGLKTSSATLMPAGTVLFTSRAPIGGLVTGVAWHHLIGKRKALRGHHQGDDHLDTVRALVSAVAELTFSGERRVALEVGTGQVIEQDVKARPEQYLPALTKKREEGALVDQQLVQASVQGVVGQHSSRTGEQILHGAMFIPVAMQPPLTTGVDELITHLRLQHLEPLRALATHRQTRLPEPSSNCSQSLRASQHAPH